MIYTKKFKIILISVIIILVIGLISLALINRSMKINELQAIAESASTEDLESDTAYTELISDTNTDTQDDSSDTTDLKNKIELPDYYSDISDEQIEKNEETLNLLVGSWSSSQSNVPVECIFTEDTMTIHYAGDDYIQETTLVYNFEILDDTNMLIEDNGVVTKESYKLYNVGEKLYFESPIKKYTSVYIKDDFVYTTTETTTEETSTETTTKKETTTEEETEEDTEKVEKIIKQYERFIETSTKEDDLDDYYDDDEDTEDEDNEDNEDTSKEEEIIEEEEETTTTAKNESGTTFDEWLLDYLENE